MRGGRPAQREAGEEGHPAGDDTVQKTVQLVQLGLEFGQRHRAQVKAHLARGVLFYFRVSQRKAGRAVRVIPFENAPDGDSVRDMRPGRQRLESAFILGLQDGVAELTRRAVSRAAEEVARPGSFPIERKLPDRLVDGCARFDPECAFQILIPGIAPAR